MTVFYALMNAPTVAAMIKAREGFTSLKQMEQTALDAVPDCK